MSFPKLECSGCDQPITDTTSKILKCFHVFDSACFNNITATKDDDQVDGFRCPKCDTFTPQADTQTPRYLVGKLAAYQQRTDNEEKSCLIHERKPPTHKCRQCKVLLCAKCKESHTKYPAHAGHVCDALQEADDPCMPLNEVFLCTEHEPPAIKTRHCATHMALICTQCIEGAHKACSTHDIPTALQGLTTKLNQNKSSLEQVANNAKQRKVEYENIIEPRLAPIKNLMAQVKDQVEKMKRKIEEDGQKLLQFLEEEESKKKIELDAKIKQLDQQIELHQGVAKSMDIAFKMAREASLLCVLVEGLFQMGEDLAGNPPQLPELREVAEVTLEFKPSDLLTRENIVGEIPLAQSQQAEE